MMRMSELVCAEALRRYDDNGEPAYTRAERLLLALRWFDWASLESLFGALDLEESTPRERGRYHVAMDGLVASGRVEKRRDRGLVEYRLLAKASENKRCKRCPQPVKAGYVLCPQHVEWQRENKQRRRGGSHAVVRHR